MSFDPSLEVPLEKGPGTSLWSENFALLMNDQEHRLGLLYSIGTWYHDPSIWREQLYLCLPGGRVLTARNFGQRPQDVTVGSAFSRYQIVEAGQRVHLAYSGPVWSQNFAALLQPGALGGSTERLQLDIEFVAAAPVWDMHAGHGSDSTSIAGAMHIEQIGHCSGRIEYAGGGFDIRAAYACRDHSRGQRDVSRYRNHCWINGRFDNGLSFQLYVFRLHGVEGHALSTAVVMQDGRQYPATIEHIEFVEGATDHGKLHRVILRSELGEMVCQVDDVLGSIPVSMTAPFNPGPGAVQERHALIFDEPIRLNWDGHVGYGWCERGASLQPL
ncbi:hypothetical protein [Pseudomonas sp. 273]|uniref:DUF7064 domain-containing protein n=1 Tax=Pseudomonas TaxID=286 RepID=UPI0023D85A65|nr:hypothetical protein [Pseudomonas sp. 273]